MTLRAPTDLVQMLTYCRPSGSKAEADFRRRFLLPLGVKPDAADNLILRVGDAPILWSCHTDTVHKHSGRQNVRIADGKIQLARRSRSACLGADDTAGCWLMREMIGAGVEGLYVFHAGEEVGGIGSHYLSTYDNGLLDNIAAAIALDRKGKTSVITHQGSRCASDEFAVALGKALGLGMGPDPDGLFTDTANYDHIIPECTNLSVGYEAAHSADETLDIGFVCRLRDALCKLTPETLGNLPITRDPLVHLEHGWTPDEGWGNSVLSGSEFHRLLNLVESDPETVADFLLHNGITALDIEEWRGV